MPIWKGKTSPVCAPAKEYEFYLPIKPEPGKKVGVLGTPSIELLYREPSTGDSCPQRKTSETQPADFRLQRTIPC